MSLSVLFDGIELNEGTNRFVLPGMVLPHLQRDWVTARNYADGSIRQVSVTTKNDCVLQVPVLYQYSSASTLDTALDTLLTSVDKASKAFSVTHSGTLIYPQTGTATIGYMQRPEYVIDHPWHNVYRARLALELVRIA